MAQDNTTPPLPVEPLLPRPGSPDYDQALNRRLYELLRLIAHRINNHESRIKELEP